MNHLPVTADFRLTQQGNSLHLQAECSPMELSHCQQQLASYFASQHVDITQLDWQLSSAAITQALSVKKRRITRKEVK